MSKLSKEELAKRFFILGKDEKETPQSAFIAGYNAGVLELEKRVERLREALLIIASETAADPYQYPYKANSSFHTGVIDCAKQALANDEVDR